MHMAMEDMVMEVTDMEVMAMDMLKVMAMVMDMEGTQMKKTLNILIKMKVSSTIPRVIAEIGCNHMGDFDLAKNDHKSI